MYKRSKLRTNQRIPRIEFLDPRVCLDASLGWHPCDVNRDGGVSPVDALMVINRLNGMADSVTAEGESVVDDPADVNADGSVTPVDALVVINDLNTEETVVSEEVSGAEESSTPTDISTGIDAGTTETPIDISTELPPDEASGSDGSGIAEEGTEGTDEAEETDETEGTDEGDDVDDCFEGERERDPVARLDANGDGALTEDEVSDRLWEHLVKADANADGSVSTAELEAARPAKPDPFDRLDANDDGSLTEDEVPANLWARLVDAAIDENSDGSISAEEFAAAKPAHVGRGPGHHPVGESAIPTRIAAIPPLGVRLARGPFGRGR